tara:strand:- start:82 stop:627 length:546 start_codon:yes stop_codon:yes gene_type:complete
MRSGMLCTLLFEMLENTRQALSEGLNNGVCTVERQEMIAAQESWGRGVVEIGAKATWEEAYEHAVSHVKSHYVLDGSLLFGPTKAAKQQFRNTLKSAVSYFVGRDEDFAEDGGFALEPWVSVRFENTGCVSQGDVGIAMGNYFFEQQDGTELKVEYSFVYVRDAQGALKIQLHHSALPYGG